MKPKILAVMPSIKAHLKSMIPDPLLNLRRRYLERKMNEYLRRTHRKDIFTRIYNRGYWGQSDNREERYYSGPGSHSPEAVEPYVTAVRDVLLSFDKKPDVVDLGCGDFTVGSQIRPYCGKYVACDIVEGLIRRNRARYSKDVEFRVVDITSDQLPEGDVVFIRQVFQHLSNSDIKKVLVQVLARYRFIILSEHLPLSDKFLPNLDKPTGPKIKIDIGESGSGVILTEPPFNLRAKQNRVLCEILQESAGCNGVIRTNLYCL